MAKAATLATTIYCRKCSYDLRGQETHRCPECGRPYDRADPKTFRRKPRGKAGKWMKRIAAALVFLLLLAATPYAWLYYEWRREQPAIERMRAAGATVHFKRINPPLPPRLLPGRYAWMLERVYEVDAYTVRLNDDDLILLARCRRMERLCAPDPSFSSFSDKGLEPLSQLRELRWLLVSGPGITDASARRLAQCRQLEFVRLYNTSLTDGGLAEICALPQLNYLRIGSPALSDAGLPSLASLPKLRYLYLYTPAIDDDGLAILARLSRLEVLRVVADHCTPAGEKRLRQTLRQYGSCDVGVYRYSPAPTPSTAPAH